jgi:hypothetical protein
MNDEEELRYPVGKFQPKDSYSTEEITQYIASIENLPSQVEKLAGTFSDAQLGTRYRDGGWTARQVLHHLADSHMNAYVRFKWTLTEETPVIKAYDEKAWAETPETTLAPAISLALLKALHVKWTALLKRLDDKSLKREFIHPETKRHIRLERMVAMYAWHGQHHLGHLKIVASKT